MIEFEQRVELLRRAYAAFNRRDIDTVLSMLDPDVEWRNMRAQTTVHGRQAVRDYWERQFQHIEAHVEPTEFIPDDDQLIVEVHQVVRDRHGHVMRDHHVAHSYTFRGQFILRMQVYPTIEDARR